MLMTPRTRSLCLFTLVAFGCNSSDGGTTATTGGAPASTGGVSTGVGGAAPATGGSAPTTKGGASGAPSTGGAPVGGKATGGSPAGGAPNGGTAGAATGGNLATGGATGGGAAGGGSGTGGAKGADPCADALFCDDFEDYTTGMPPAGEWMARTNGGAVVVDEAQHSSGAKAVKFTTMAKDGTKTAFIRLTSDAVFPLMGNAYYGRMMFRLEAAPTESVHWTLLQSTGTVPGQTYRAQYRYGGQHPILEAGAFVGSQWMANYETPDSYSGTGPSSDCWRHADKTVIPVAKWSCVEWEFDGESAGMRLWLDGAPLEDLTVMGTGQGCVSQDAAYPWTAPTFADLEVGWESYQMDGERTLYIDDVVISKSKVGCPQ